MQPRVKGKFVSVPAAERFWSKVDTTGSCWLWTGYKDKWGYGQFSFKGKPIKAYTWSYEESKGKVPTGLELDHLCENPPCVNPTHLEAVTHQENNRRGMVKKRRTHCKRGHEFTPESTYMYPNQFGTFTRRCRTCNVEKKRANYAQSKLDTQIQEGTE